MKNIFKKRIFSDEEILELRKLVENNYDFYSNIKFSELNCDDPIYEYLFSDKLLQFLESNLKDEVYLIGESIIQKNNRTYEKVRYHRDSGKTHQSDILSDKKNIYGKIGIPLQDNIKSEGGGIDYLKPFFLDNFSDKNKILNKLRALYYILQDKFADTHLYTKAGDVIFFSAMLSHRTSYTDKSKVVNLKDKYVIYYQLANYNTIKNVLKVTRKQQEDLDLKNLQKEIITINIKGKKIKILGEGISKEVSSYMGL
tara:strand:+ start:344 stop:1108 length:765 start_codon:yes stop_codon:yes gene_type:complete